MVGLEMFQSRKEQFTIGTEKLNIFMKQNFEEYYLSEIPIIIQKLKNITLCNKMFKLSRNCWQ